MSHSLLGTDLLEAVNDLADLLEAKPVRRSLRHHPHIRHVRKGHRAVRKVMADYFQRQKAAIVRAVRPLLGLWREDRKTAEERAAFLIPDSLSPLRFSITAAESHAFDTAISNAIEAAGRQLARELATSTTLPQTFAGDYLRQNSLSKLTGELADTTRDRLRTAIADAFEGGGYADDIIAAIERTMDDMSSKRAGVIAQTEVNAAYNAGRAALANAAGMNEKSWVTESGNPCPSCLGNEGQGWIPISNLFQSGDAAPTAHPMCYCSLDFRTVT